MFTFTCSHGAHLHFPLTMNRSHEVLCPKCFECFIVLVQGKADG